MTTQNQIGFLKSRGAIYLSNNSSVAGSGSINAGVWTELSGLITPWALGSNSSADFTMPVDGRLKYTGINQKTFDFFINLNLVNIPVSAGITVGKNGSALSAFAAYNGNASAGAYLSAFGSLTLNTDDHASVMVYSAGTTGTRTVYSATLLLTD